MYSCGWKFVGAAAILLLGSSAIAQDLTADQINQVNLANNPHQILSSITEFTFPLPFPKLGDGLSSPYGAITNPTNPLTEPTFGLVGTNLALLSWAPCTFLMPHIHPGGTEMEYIVSGNLTVFMQTGADTGIPIVSATPAGTASIFPQGQLHGQMNLGCEQANVFVFFDNAFPGVVFYPPSNFNVPEEILISLNMTSAADSFISNPMLSAPFAPGSEIPPFYPLDPSLCSCPPVTSTSG